MYFLWQTVADTKGKLLCRVRLGAGLTIYSNRSRFAGRLIPGNKYYVTTPVATDIATRWIEKWAAPDGPSGDSDGNDLDWELPFENPRLCLDSILQVLSRIPADPADKHFQVLAAGPLEDLLIHHGSTYVDEIEVLARRSPPFRLLLNGVWTSRVDKAVVERLDKYRRAQW